MAGLSRAGEAPTYAAAAAGVLNANSALLLWDEWMEGLAAPDAVAFAALHMLKQRRAAGAWAGDGVVFEAS